MVLMVVRVIIALTLFTAALEVPAQSPITTLALGPDKIGEVKTAMGLITRIVFTEPVQEIICGDLYDPVSGKGAFVVQKSGAADHPGNDVFIKPVASKGTSNMFVKTGDSKHTYNLDLSIVPAAQAHRVVNITDTASVPPAPEPESEKPVIDHERLKAEAEQQARQKAAEIIRGAQQQADRKLAEADAKIAEAERQSQQQAQQRADQEIERRFMQALTLGLIEVKVANTRAVTKKKVIITLDPRMLVFSERAYLRYMIQNASGGDFAYTAIELEVGDGKEVKPLTCEVNQSKPENLLASGESLTGVLVFDPKQVEAKRKLTLYVRGHDNAELAHLGIQD
jgi:type IV secretory pathway VirB9-like protein